MNNVNKTIKMSIARLEHRKYTYTYKKKLKIKAKTNENYIDSIKINILNIV
jgi:hypothetical protein